MPCHMKPVVPALESADFAVPRATAASSFTQSVFFVSGSSIPAGCPWERAMGRESRRRPREVPCPRAAGTRFGVVLGHLRVKDRGCLAGVQPCFSERFVWPLVPAAVHVACPSGSRAGFEANASLCYTWSVVLACALSLSVQLGGNLRFHRKLVRPRHHHHSADTYAVEDAAPVLSPGTARPGRFHLAGGAEGYRTARARPLPSGVSLNFSKHEEISSRG